MNDLAWKNFTLNINNQNVSIECAPDTTFICGASAINYGDRGPNMVCGK